MFVFGFVKIVKLWKTALLLFDFLRQRLRVKILELMEFLLLIKGIFIIRDRILIPLKMAVYFFKIIKKHPFFENSKKGCIRFIQI